MAARSATIRQAASRAAVAARWGTPEQASVAKRDLAAERIADYVARVLAEAPPLTDAQRHRLAELLAPGADAVARAAESSAA